MKTPQLLIQMADKLVELICEDWDWHNYDLLFFQDHIEYAFDFVHVHSIALLFELVDMCEKCFILEVVLLKLADFVLFVESTKLSHK